MAFIFRNQLDAMAERRAVLFYGTLSEKDRRQYMAVEALRLGHGGVACLSKLPGCSTRTIERGIAELDQLPDDPARGRTRRPGAGRKKKIPNDSQLEDTLTEMMEVRTGGDPDLPDFVFTNLSPTEMATSDRATVAGTPVSDNTGASWLDSLSIGYRKTTRDISGGLSADREQQFERIGERIEEYQLAGNPVFSVDTKSKEFLGRLYRAGRIRTSQSFRAFDHDFPSWADGVVIPHSIYDLSRNAGHINPGLSRDTSRFAVDSLKW